MKKQTVYSLPEEIVNISTHGVGLAMALAVCIYFLVRSGGSGSWLKAVGTRVFLPFFLPVRRGRKRVL